MKFHPSEEGWGEGRGEGGWQEDKLVPRVLSQPPYDSVGRVGGES